MHPRQPGRRCCLAIRRAISSHLGARGAAGRKRKRYWVIDDEGRDERAPALVGDAVDRPGRRQGPGIRRCAGRRGAASADADDAAGAGLPLTPTRGRPCKVDFHFPGMPWLAAQVEEKEKISPRRGT